MSQRKRTAASAAWPTDGGSPVDGPTPVKSVKLESVASLTEDDEPGEMMLGSPDAPTSLLNGEPRTTALRISARVLRKKEERQGSESETVGGPSLADEPPMVPAAAVRACPAVSMAESEKPRRTWEQWSTQDKNMFFEGLNEYGKNFDSIEGHFQSKSKKKTMLKTREQIRTFYYRTWHKISAHIVFPDQLKKSVRELYGLINYGELRKRLGGKLDEKNGAKLQELVFTGLTTIRVKGKTYRVKTPICRALKRLVTKLEGTKTSGAHANGHSQKTVIPSMPDHVTVDLKPLNENDFYQVHSNCFQNPHIQITVGLSQRVASLIDFLDKKWSAKTPQRLKTDGQDWELWIQTKPGTVLNRPALTSVEPLTHTSLSLSNIQEKIRPSPSSSIQVDPERKPEPEDVQNMTLSAPALVEEEADPPPVITAKMNAEVKTEESQSTNDDQLVITQWNKAQGATVTFGELFLMLGLSGNKNMELCYHFKELTAAIDDLEHHQLKPRFTQVPTTAILARMAQTELARKQNKVLSSPGAKSGASLGPWKSPSAQSPANSPRTPKASELHVNNESARLGHEEFRRPSAPPAKINSNQSSAQAFKQQLSMLLPKYSNRKGRTTTRKTNVVSRQLLANRPLQPKNNLISKDGVMKVRIVSDPTKDVLEAPPGLPSLIATSLVNPVSLSPVPNLPKAPMSPEIPTISIPDSSRPGSPTGSISSLFEGSLSDLASGSGSGNNVPTPHLHHTPTKSDHFLDSVLENSNSSVLQTPPRHRPTPPSSPSRAVHDSWLPELSLSSLLESPIKNGSQNTHPATINEDSIQSVGSEVDRQILLMMTENSVDFTNKFAKLASHVNND
ncbi:hypothetical protein TCAL_16930 [Tigriopus californicus]|uniref:SANT domain-containing protein n=1 Tax=Tigriopus californicus TaxID=6832 RepID=A0A553NR28_TIGCA|nr:uncharacterized protein LOC131878742 [Tigriopus californicus]TRY67860.1 hypothetical protein TCAL_16930 [Tigriopus californicus]